MECVRDHPEMILRPEHFASFQSNWEPKPENLRRVAKELDIGLDSLVFVDDNPVERAAVRAMLPEVTVVELPSQPIGYLDALRSEPRLDVLRASVDDAKRAEMYQQEHRRKASSNVHESLEQFLEGLKMEATTGELAHGDLDRVHQLVSKTNQFNLTTRRHTAAYMDTLSKSPDAAVLWMRLKDRFGDLGLVCVGILQHVEGRQWEIDTLLMSCRVMGRGVEDAFLAFLHGTALERGAEYVRGVFVPTSRNIAVQDFYSSRGYRWVRDAPGGETEWELELTPESATWPSHIFRARTSLEADHA